MSIVNWAVRISVLNGLPLVGGSRKAVVVYDKFEKNPSLKGLRQGIMLARRNGDQERHVVSFARKAIKRFPKRDSGYVALAEHYIALGEFRQARSTLENAPQSDQVRKLLLDLPNSDQNQLFSERNSGLSQEEILRRSQDYVFRHPYEWWGYKILAEIIIQTGKHSRAEEMLKKAPKKVREQLGFYLQLADLAASRRDQLGEIKILLAAQAHFPTESRILQRLASLYRDDNQVERAYALHRAMQLRYPVLGTIRRLSFEVDCGYLAEANKTFDIIASFSSADKAKFLPNWGRLAPRFPERAAEFANWRKEARDVFQRLVVKSTNELNVAIGRGIKARWIADCDALIERSAENGVYPSAEVQHWLDDVKVRLGAIGDLIEYGLENEAGDELVALQNGVPLSISQHAENMDNIVEFFIPSAFFARPEEEKSSYETVREFMRSVAEALVEYPDIVLVVRHQFNWRHANLRLGRRAVSYHTSDETATGRLHIQESPLAGRCSVDRVGFAGYAEIAENFSLVEARTRDVPIEALRENLRDLVSFYVEGNVSKYTQADAKPFVVEGPYVFVAMQIPTDIVAEIAYVTGIDMLRIVADHYAESGTKVVVKRHPYCSSISVQKTIGELEAAGKIVTADASIHDLISSADVVFCVNSGVGLEALMHMKPVVVTGKCDYAYAVSHQAKSEDDLKSALSRPITLDEDRVLKLLYYYKNIFTKDPSKAAVRQVLDDWLATTSTPDDNSSS